jgi:hypothetical protein
MKRKHISPPANQYTLAEEFYNDGHKALKSDPVQAFAFFRAARWNILTADVYTEQMNMDIQGQDGNAFGIRMRDILTYSARHMLSITTGTPQYATFSTFFQLLLYLAMDIDNYVSFYPNVRGEASWDDENEKLRYTRFTRECVNYAVYKANLVTSRLLDKQKALPIFKVYNDALADYYSRLSWSEPQRELSRINMQGAERWEEYSNCATEASKTESCADPSALLSVFSGHLTQALSPIPADRKYIYESLVRFNDFGFWDSVEALLSKIAAETA